MISYEKLGIIPDTEKDSTKDFFNFLVYCKQNGIKGIVLPKGVYYFYNENAVESDMPIDEITDNEELYYLNSKENSSTKKFALLFEKMNDFVFDGNGSSFVINNFMSNIGINECKNITIKNLSINHKKPSFVEYKVIEKEKKTAVFKLADDATYDISNKKMFLSSKDYQYLFSDKKNFNITKIAEKKFFSMKKNPFGKEKNSMIFGEGFIKTVFSKKPEFSCNDIFVQSLPHSVEGGIIIKNSSDILLKNISQFACDSTGIYAIDSKNLKIDYINIIPKNRIVSCPKDFCSFFMCSGFISITNSNFSGAMRNGIDIKGEYFVISGIEGRKIEAKYSNKLLPKTLGKDDALEFSDKDTFEKISRGKIEAIEIVDENTINIILKNLPVGIEKGDLIENITKAPGIVISNNYFSNVAENCIMATTSMKTVVANNKFENIGESCIFIENDGKTSFRSGKTNELTIKNNKFESNGTPVAVSTKYAKKSCQIHSNIRIQNNKFFTNNIPSIEIKNARNVKLIQNEFQEEKKKAIKLQKSVILQDKE